VAELQAQLAALRCSPPDADASDAEHAAGASFKPPQHEVVTFTGGTGFNSVCAELKRYTTRVAHVLPVSDDGGSTAEIVRVLGGPAVGDIRSRCLRLADNSNDEARAVRALLGHRLPAEPATAKAEWYTIVEGTHELWAGVSGPYQHTVRSFLAHFHFQLIRQANDGGAGFCFSGGSIGNFFFAGARIFFRSLDAAIFLFSRVSGIPPDSVVLPVVSTNGRLLLGAELANGNLLRGQTAISHPDAPTSPRAGHGVDKSRGSSAELPLPSRVRRVLYLSTEETDELHEVFPRVNPAVLARLQSADAVVYGVGSLWSSICPSLIPAGVGEAVAARDCAKVLMLNGSRDRETTGMGVMDIVRAVTSSLNRQHARGASRGARPLDNPPSAYVTAVLAPAGGEFDAEAARRELAAAGIQTVLTVASEEDHGRVIFRPRALVHALRSVVELQRAQLADRAGYHI
jgi:cathepsin L